MKIAIVDKKGSFSDSWINYCQNNNIRYKLVNPYATDVISQVRDCSAFMWHWHHADYRDRLIAISLIKALEAMSIKCFPDLNTCLHFDNKIAQKYLLEAINAPLVPSYIFLNDIDALDWASTTSLPKVFKLKGGAGSSNVYLIRTQQQAKKFIKKSFSSGFKQFRHIDNIKEAFRQKVEGVGSWRSVFRCIYYLLSGHKTEFSRYQGNEIGYLYAQDFVPNNDSDTRVCIVNGRAFALKRMCRKNDFRASGSGHLIYDTKQIDLRCIQISFDIARKIQAQSIALDYVFDKNGTPLLVEISYGFAPSAYKSCEGYWTDNMTLHPGNNFDFEGWMVESCLKS